MESHRLPESPRLHPRSVGGSERQLHQGAHGSAHKNAAGRREEYDRKGRLYFPLKTGGRLRLKRHLDEQPGKHVQNLWTDIPPINSRAQERLGYPTQKPEALLERIIKAS